MNAQLPPLDSARIPVPENARLILATHNYGKLAELRALLAPLVTNFVPEQIISANDINAPEPIEDGLSFAANAEIKACTLAKLTHLPAIADDSGLCVDVLGGAPGIFSARWCGRHGDDQANLNLLLAQLADIPDPYRTAHFTCAAVVAIPQIRAGNIHNIKTTVKQCCMPGRLLCQPIGTNGFGYDPIFVPAQEDKPGGKKRTSAQLEAAEKNAISHRGRALRALAPILADLLN